jgi:hypothetical protein
MAPSAIDVAVPRAVAVGSDGRAIAVPLNWYRRLAHASSAERGNRRPIGNGEGVHWPELDEDISVAALLAGRRSAESQASLQRWLAARKKATERP